MTRPFIPLVPGARAARWASLGLALTLLSACSVTPPYQRPEMPVPATFKEAGAAIKEVGVSWSRRRCYPDNLLTHRG